MPWNTLKDQFFKFLRSEFVKLALKKILGNAMMGGVKAWIIKLVAVHLYDEVAVPVMQLLIRKGLFYYDTKKGHITFKKFEKAKEENDESTYNDVVDNA